MALKSYVTDKQIEDLEARVGRVQRSIEDARVIAKGGTDGLKKAIESFKAYRQNVIALKNDCFQRTNHVKMMRAIEYAGEEKALDVIINTFENSKADISFYQNILTPLEKQLNEWKKLPRRE